MCPARSVVTLCGSEGITSRSVLVSHLGSSASSSEVGGLGAVIIVDFLLIRG